jgi:hypothetical protein
MFDGVRYRGSVKTARTKAQAEQAEVRTKARVHEGTCSKPKGGITLKKFVADHYLPWAKANKRSWKIDRSRLKAILVFFANRRIRTLARLSSNSSK